VTLLRLIVFAILARGATDIRAIVVNHVTDLASVLTCVRPRIGHGAPETHVIANDGSSVRIFEKIIDVGLPHAEVPVEIASIVGFLAISHLLLLEGESITSS
jgi:hypothetical protein